jgi:hypothetical protein
MLRKSLTFFLFFLLNLSVQAQTDSATLRLKHFVRNIEKFRALYPQEKVYLHFDNTGYYLGETLWFKAWLVTAENNRLSPMSKVLYVDLLTPEGDVLQSQKLKVENGQANGSFLLKDSLYAGYYEVRAYTKCMMNFGEDVIFSRVFPVFDKPKEEGSYAAKRMTLRPGTKALNSGREKPEKLDNIDVTFFPEGGNLVTDLSNRLAFKAVNKQGKSIDITGTLLNSKGEEVSSFTSMYRGMGAFIFYPDGGKYSAKITAGDKTVKVELPKAIPSGYSLQVNNYQPQEMQVQITKTTDLPSDTVGLSFMCRGKVYAFKTFSLASDQPALFTIPKDIFPSGVIQITVFNAKGQILAERLAFVNQDDALQLKTEINTTYQPFSPININFQLNDSQGNPLESTFSLSVRDRGTEIYTGYSDDVRSNLLLSSELKGFIENPGYYFEKNDVRHVAALDMLLLTQGWRRYEWKKMAGVDKFDVKQGIEKGLVVDGKILTDIGKKEKENVDVTMWMLTPYQKGTCTTDKQGNFNLALDDFYGKVELNIETRINGKLRDHRIQLNRAFNPSPKAYETTEVTLPDSIPTYRQTVETIAPVVGKVEEKKTPTNDVKTKESMNEKNHTLKELTVTEKKKWSQKQEGASQADIVYDVNKEIDKLRDKGESEPSNIFDFLYQQRGVFSANLDGFNDKLSCTYMGKDVIFIVNNTLARISDGSRENINNYDRANPINNTVIPTVYDLDMSLVESIMIVQSSTKTLGYCTECDRGKEYTLIYIYTNPDKALVDGGGKRKTIFEGYSNVRQFYSPDYKAVGLPDEKDHRRTLYWNPNVKTDSHGVAKISIFNNINCKMIDILTEGVTKEGLIK